jgi:nitrogen regulatory protein PII
MTYRESTALKLVTIVCETVLLPRITGQLLKWGSTGYTVTPAQGRGSRGTRTGDIPGECHRVEAVVDDATAERILSGVSDHYFENYAVIAWVADVQVVRGTKYVGAGG